jgi:predicted acylesterase/phospholipase RssA
MTSYEMVDFIKCVIKKDYIAKLDIDEVFNVLNTYGINSGTLIERLISDALMQKIGVGDITFVDLAKHTGKNLVVCVANVSKERDEYWSVDTTPTVSVIKAVRASCSLPFIFTPVHHKGDVYVDGGMYNHFPIGYFKEGQMADVVGVVVRGLYDETIDSIFSYMTKLLNSTINVTCKKNTPKYIIENVVSLDVENQALFSYDTMKLTLTEDNIDNFVDKGYNETKKQLAVCKRS